MPRTVQTLGTVVDAEIAALPKDRQAAFLRLGERIEAVGLERVGHPHVKHLRDKLWQMRFSGSAGGTASLGRFTSPSWASGLSWGMLSSKEPNDAQGRP